MASSLTLPKLPIFNAIAGHDPQSIAVVHCLSGRTFRYGEILPDVCRARDRIYAAAGKSDLRGERVAFLVENSYDYVVTFLAILAARAVALPLSPPFPAPELQYILSQSGASLLLHSPRYAEKASEVLSTPFPEPSPNPAPELQPPPTVSELPKHLGAGPSVRSFETVSLLAEEAEDGAGMMLYTSGTTNRPKGVLLPAAAIAAQCRSLVEAWAYGPADRLLHVLPLHHIHGTVNALLTPLFAGSSVEFLFPFSADAVWRRFALPFLDTSTSSNGISNGGTSEDPTTAELDSRTQGLLHHHDSADENKLTAHMSRVPVTFFTVVPTVYTRLLSTYPQLPTSPGPSIAAAARTAIGPAHMRVAISGSAALPTPLKKAWRDLSRGTVLLERYGMTEVGMALSCGLDPADRVDGSVGWPLPGVEARLVDTDTGEVIPEPAEVEEETTEDTAGVEIEVEPGIETEEEKPVGEEGDGAVATTTTTTTAGGGRRKKQQQQQQQRERSGEIQLRGPNVFREYWNNASATSKEFVAAAPDDPNQARWFKTGDVAVRRPIPGEDRRDRGVGAGRSGPWARGPMWFILGRQSADIIKSGGEKVSALEVERELLSLPEVAEAAVLAVPSGRWGQKVGAVVVMAPGLAAATTWKPMDMRRALRGRLANYKIPQVLRVVDRIERNAMGKINKKVLVKKVFLEEFSGDEM